MVAFVLQHMLAISGGEEDQLAVQSVACMFAVGHTFAIGGAGAVETFPQKVRP